MYTLTCVTYIFFDTHTHIRTRARAHTHAHTFIHMSRIIFYVSTVFINFSQIIIHCSLHGYLFKTNVIIRTCYITRVYKYLLSLTRLCKILVESGLGWLVMFLKKNFPIEEEIATGRKISTRGKTYKG